jgi:NAD(P)-dependent dehydrogenase (short-subunit alcohol dehydrogenase family)
LNSLCYGRSSSINELSNAQPESNTTGVRESVMSRVLITGASRGIGRATAVALTARGHEVIATARDIATLGDVPAAARLSLDVTDEQSVAAAVEAAGRVDVLISNAGATVRAPIETVPIAEVQRLFELNTFGALRVAQAVLGGMRERGWGKLVFMSSIQGRVAIPLIGPYAASKWALEAIAETLAIEVRHFGVSVHVLQPGAVSSGGAERAKSFVDKGNPYAPLLDQLAGFRAAPVSVEQVAAAVGSVLEDSDAPFRVPVGAPAVSILAARKAAPEDVPFLAAPLEW